MIRVDGAGTESAGATNSVLQADGVILLSPFPWEVVRQTTHYITEQFVGTWNLLLSHVSAIEKQIERVLVGHPRFWYRRLPLERPLLWVSNCLGSLTHSGALLPTPSSCHCLHHFAHGLRDGPELPPLLRGSDNEDFRDEIGAVLRDRTGATRAARLARRREHSWSALISTHRGHLFPSPTR